MERRWGPCYWDVFTNPTVKTLSPFLRIKLFEFAAMCADVDGRDEYRGIASPFGAVWLLDDEIARELGIGLAQWLRLFDLMRRKRMARKVPRTDGSGWQYEVAFWIMPAAQAEATRFPDGRRRDIAWLETQADEVEAEEPVEAEERTAQIGRERTHMSRWRDRFIASMYRNPTNREEADELRLYREEWAQATRWVERYEAEHGTRPRVREVKAFRVEWRLRQGEPEADGEDSVGNVGNAFGGEVGNVDPIRNGKVGNAACNGDCNVTDNVTAPHTPIRILDIDKHNSNTVTDSVGNVTNPGPAGNVTDCDVTECGVVAAETDVPGPLERTQSFELLCRVGVRMPDGEVVRISEPVARAIAARHRYAYLQRTAEWLPYRTRDRGEWGGLWRSSIEGKWEPPQSWIDERRKRKVAADAAGAADRHRAKAQAEKEAAEAEAARLRDLYSALPEAEREGVEAAARDRVPAPLRKHQSGQAYRAAYDAALLAILGDIDRKGANHEHDEPARAG